MAIDDVVMVVVGKAYGADRGGRGEIAKQRKEKKRPDQT